jgi:hypothetical protein
MLLLRVLVSARERNVVVPTALSALVACEVQGREM